MKTTYIRSYTTNNIREFIKNRKTTNRFVGFHDFKLYFPFTITEKSKLISVQKSQDNSKVKLQGKYKNHLTSAVLNIIHSLKIKINYFTLGHTCRKVSRSNCHIFNVQLASLDADILLTPEKEFPVFTLDIEASYRSWSDVAWKFCFLLIFSPFNLQSSDYNRYARWWGLCEWLTHTSIPKSYETNSTMFVGLIWILNI